MLETSNLTLVPGKQIILAVCLAFIPVGAYVVSLSWTRLAKRRLHMTQKMNAGEHQWCLMQPLGEARPFSVTGITIDVAL